MISFHSSEPVSEFSGGIALKSVGRISQDWGEGFQK